MVLELQKKGEMLTDGPPEIPSLGTKQYDYTVDSTTIETSNHNYTHIIKILEHLAQAGNVVDLNNQSDDASEWVFDALHHLGVEDGDTIDSFVMSYQERHQNLSNDGMVGQETLNQIIVDMKNSQERGILYRPNESIIDK